MEQLQGTLENVIYQSGDGGFCVLRVKTAAGLATVTYKGMAPYMGENIAMEGEWCEHVRFGRQFRADALRVVKPSTTDGIERFLASGAVKGIGRTMAARIVEHFGSRTLTVMESEPERLTEVAGIGRKKAESIAASYAELSEMRELMLFLEQHGVSANYAPKLQARYGSTALVRVQENPYALAGEVTGIGFRTADKIALALGCSRSDRRRIEAGLVYALNMAASAGHTCVPEELLAQETVKLLQTDPEPVKELFKELIDEDRLRTEEVGGLRLIYPEYLYQAETQTAKRLIALRDAPGKIKSVDVEKIISQWEREAGIQLAAAQKEAIHASLKYGVFVLTGGPGTGKTTVVKGIITVLEKAGCRILLAAPTGRAAKRLAESSGHPAQTVHRLLEYQPDGSGFNFGKNDSDPLDAEAIIIDEASMLDITLMHHLLKAVPGGCRLIFVGDVDQLPSVGPGSVLKDIIRSKKMPVVRLENVFRQAEVSPIVRNAHRINHGQMPEFAEHSDFEFAGFDNEFMAADFVAQLYGKVAAEHSLQYVQVLSPMHKNPCGVQNLNKVLQQHLNPPAADKGELTLPGGAVLREGDKVMQIRNNYEKEVFNGDIGRIIRIDGGNVTVVYDDGGKPVFTSFEDEYAYAGISGNKIVYTSAEVDELQLAYAMSVHKSQGSEYPVVILLMVPGHYIMLQRNLFYTAVTRARQKVVIVGSKKAVQAAVLNDKTRKRYSLLAERLQEQADVF